MKELYIVRDEYSQYQCFRAFMNNRQIGDLYTYQENELWVIEEFHATLKRRGIGSALLREFSTFIGRNQLIEMLIIHRPSISAIRANGLLPETVTNEVVIGDPEKLSLLPMTRILHRGNIEATQLKFKQAEFKSREKDILASYEVYLYGITK